MDAARGWGGCSKRGDTRGGKGKARWQLSFRLSKGLQRSPEPPPSPPASPSPLHPKKRGLAAASPHPRAFGHCRGMVSCCRLHVAVVPSDRLEIEHLIWPQRDKCRIAGRAHGRTSLQRPRRGGLAASKHCVCFFLSLSLILFITLVGFFNYYYDYSC